MGAYKHKADEVMFNIYDEAVFNVAMRRRRLAVKSRLSGIAPYSCPRVGRLDLKAKQDGSNEHRPVYVAERAEPKHIY